MGAALVKTIYSFNEFSHSKLGLKFYFVFHLKEVFAKDDTSSAFRKMSSLKL